jgi:hypothetical protein
MYVRLSSLTRHERVRQAFQPDLPVSGFFGLTCQPGKADVQAHLSPRRTG